MEMKCLRENLQMERLVGSAQGQAAVEGEITLPGGLREEARVLSAGAMVVLDNVEAQQDKVVLEGRVVFHALYTQGDPDKPQAMEASADFTHTLDLPGAQARMLCRGDAAVEHVEAAAYSGRLGLKAILQTRCRVLSSQPVAALTAAFAPDQSRPAQRGDDLFKILETDVLRLRDGLERRVAHAGTSGKFYHNTEGVAALGKEFHGFTPAVFPLLAWSCVHCHSRCCEFAAKRKEQGAFFAVSAGRHRGENGCRRGMVHVPNAAAALPA